MYAYKKILAARAAKLRNKMRILQVIGAAFLWCFVAMLTYIVYFTEGEPGNYDGIIILVVLVFAIHETKLASMSESR